ncbi:hypothetical protein GTJ59_23335 [Enterobacter hormaechei]|uniref:hypothetical protein n=1 Tax=Enterobacter cloacae complex TaxID=354276 RepID=UPI0013B88E4C|nr:hypothetical protein [Enterobacter hormaechei]MXR83669.1 hypothetical protein [Enterobacter hormaechei]MXR88353.1 hypothetical protein [Enterobacter hormaechei]
MSNIDKHAVQAVADLKAGYILGHADVEIIQQMALDAVTLMGELDAKDRRNSELTEALKQTVSGYKSCLRMGHDRILDLGGDCDSPEVMIAGNPDIQQAEKLIAAAAGKVEAS